MRNRKRFAVLTTALVLSVSLLGGCKEKTEDNSTGKAPQEEANGEKGGDTIVVAASSGWVTDIDKELAKKYEEESGNTIQWQLSPDDQYASVLNSKFAVGEGPDVYYSQSGAGMVEFQPAEHALDLSGEEWVSRYRDWAKEGTAYEGKTIQCLTWSADGFAILYNPAIFEQAGVKQVPKTFEEFKAVCEAIKNIGITPVFEGGATQWKMGTWLDTLSAQAEEESPGLRDKLNAGQANIADIEGIKTGLNQLKELTELGYFGEDYMSNTWEKSIDAMGKGECAMILTATTYTNDILAKYPDCGAEDWAMFPSPLNDNTMFSQSSGGIGRTVNKDSNVVDAVKDYFNFLTRKDNLQAYYDACPYLGQCAFTDIEGNTTNAYTSLMENSTGVGRNFETGISKWNSTEVGVLVQNMLLGGSADDVITGIDDMRDTMFKK